MNRLALILLLNTVTITSIYSMNRMIVLTPSCVKRVSIPIPTRTAYMLKAYRDRCQRDSCRMQNAMEATRKDLKLRWCAVGGIHEEEACRDLVEKRLYLDEKTNRLNNELEILLEEKD